MSANWSAALTATAAAMENMARFALPIAVRHAASVLTAASSAADTDMRRRRRASRTASAPDRAGYSRRTTNGANASSAAAQGRARASVTPAANRARRLPSAPSPRAMHAATAGTEAATSPEHRDAGSETSESALPE